MANPWAILDSVDAEPARLHIMTCIGAGMSLRAVAASAGVSATTACAIKVGNRKTCLPQTRDAILMVRPGVTREATRGTTEPFVPKLGSVRRIQALLALGWPHTEIGVRSGIRTQNIGSQTGHWVTLSTHQAIEQVYAELSARQGPSAATRGRAQRLGYLSPAAWDDIDHDAEPDIEVTDDSADAELDEIAIERRMAGDKTIKLTPDERVELARRGEAAGLSVNSLEQTTGLNTRRYRQRTAA